MTDTTNSDLSGTQPSIHPLYVRVTHWINALAVLVMIGSGWQIYNASPLFPFTFPRSALRRTTRGSRKGQAREDRGRSGPYADLGQERRPGAGSPHLVGMSV